MERNPYSPPIAVVADVDHHLLPKRPRLLLAYYAFALLANVLVVILVVARVNLPGVSQLPASTHWKSPYFEAVALHIILTAGTLVQLFRYRRIAAAYFATAALVSRLAITFGKIPGTVIIGQHLVGTLLGLALNVFVVVYIWWLVRKGALT